MKKGKLFLIPTSLGNDDLSLTLPALVLDVLDACDELIVENLKSAVKFLGLAKIQKPVQDVVFHILNVDTRDEEISGYLDAADAGKNIGLLSEAGCPCVADPGSKVVAMAHKKRIQVVPLTGPTSVILSLMGSGLGGQSFAFHGYLPIDRTQREEKIRAIERLALTQNQTQIFMEAPHRNDHLLESIIKTCRGDTRLCVAVDLTLPTESVVMRHVSEWKRELPRIGKRPAVFLLGV